MFKRGIVFVLLGCLLLFNVTGCVALLAGAAGGVGTAVWLSGKLTQEVNTPYQGTVNAAKSALSSLKLEITKETKEEDITQLRSQYTDGKDIWIDIRKLTEYSSKIEVRVGAVSPDKQAADTILKRIQRYL